MVDVRSALQQRTEEERKQIADWIAQSGINQEDPLFNLYAEIGQTQALLLALPDKLKSVVVGWTNMIDDKLNNTADVALQQQKTAIALAAQELISKRSATVSSSPIGNWKLAQLGALLGSVLALGTFLGVFTYITVARTYVTSNANKVPPIPPITEQDRKLLQWLKSPEGKSARDIYIKNAAIIKTCRSSKKYTGACIIDVQ
ncbi:hypothetical protein PI95_003995 [Hassallia byssoidea VB512170]|uniref:Uncharacterized protein n=1 Tax=Hassallia byssoidea VB512170 TaxID=1304833 RepID=A0A846H565_9CYAN|nr:DUF6753 family protein [Hassalia byssoidea]NEU71764.1 hypothetical protein [Hassalia byssoidea VB512170]